MYNLPRFNELECDSKDRPLYPPRIERTEVLLEPFDDIIPRAKPQVKEEAPKKPRKREKKNLSLLSFGEEAAEEESTLEKVQVKVKSSHDVLDDPRFSKQSVDMTSATSSALKKSEASARRSATQAAIASAALKARASSTDSAAKDGEVDFEERMRQQLRERQQRIQREKLQASMPSAGEPGPATVPAGGQSKGDELAKQDVRVEYERLRDELVAGSKEGTKNTSLEEGGRKRHWKWRGKGATNAQDSDGDDDGEDGNNSDDGMTALEKRRAKYLERKRASAALTKKQRQIETMQKLAGFQNSLAEDTDTKDAAERAGLKGHALKFSKESRMAETASTYDSFDPLLHGSDSSRAAAKIKDREKIMQSMKQGWANDDE